MLAALAVADLYEIPREASIRALCAYKPLPHRLEKVGEIDGVVYLNDSKATNIDALEKALLAMRTPVVLLAGGKDKGLDFTGLRPLAAREGARRRAHRPDDRQAVRRLEFRRAVPQVRLARRSRASRRAGSPIRGDTVLFSPGCSSYDMFKSFEDRGDQFRALVQATPAQPTSKDQHPTTTNERENTMEQQRQQPQAAADRRP